MASDANQIKDKVVRYVIGASILLLALISFSKISCSILGLCTSWLPFARFVGFWELMGISTAILFAGFSARMLLRSQNGKTPPTSHNDGNNATQLPPTLSNESDSSRENVASGGCNGSDANKWKSLCEQLSPEEKAALKSLMEKHCDCGTPKNSVIKPESTNTQQAKPLS